MPDDLTNPGPEDGKLIALTEDHEADYWCSALKVSPERLRQAVDAAGNSAAYVRAWLAEHPE